MYKTPIMRCGHAASGTLDDGRAVCAICYGINAVATEPLSKQPTLEGRTAYCTDCGKAVPSKSNLPFFRWEPLDIDRYYCGCKGWD